MRLHANARTCPHSRRLIAVRVLEQGWTLAQAAEAAGASVRTASKWVARYRAEGAEGLADRSSEPLSSPHRTGEERVEAIASLRRLRMTAAEIAECLRMPLSTVSAVLTRIGLGKLSRLEPLEPANRYREAAAGRADPYRCQEARPDREGRPPRHRQPARQPQRDRLGVRPRLCRRRDQARLRRGARRREGRHCGRLLAPGRRALRRPRHPGAETDDRQRARLHLDRPQARLHRARDQTHPHQALPAPNQREGRTLHPHHARRLGLRRDLRQLGRTPTARSPAGSTTTIADDHTAASATNHP